MGRDYFSALPVYIRRHILTCFESEFVKRDLHGNVSYIGQAALGGFTKAANFQREVRSWRLHRFAWVSRQFREDFLDLFYSLNKFDFASANLLIGFVGFKSTDRRRFLLTSLRFTLKQHARTPVSSDCGHTIESMQIIYQLFLSCVNLKELEICAQIHWNTGWKGSHKDQSVTYAVEDALSHFQGAWLNSGPLTFGPIIEKEPRRHGYDEDPMYFEPFIPRDLRGKVDRVKWMLATAFEIVLREFREDARQGQQRFLSGTQEVTGGEAQGLAQPLSSWRKDPHPQRNGEAMRAGPVDVEFAVPLNPEPIRWTSEYPDHETFMPSNPPGRCPTHYANFHPGCSMQPQIPPLQAPPQNPVTVDSYEPRSCSNWYPNHHGILDPTYPQNATEGTGKMDPRTAQWHAPLPEPLATVQPPTTAHSPRSHALLVERVFSWLDRTNPLYLLPSRDPNIFAYYLAMMECAWNNNLEQSRIDVMTRAILARVDGIAFRDWLHKPSGIPDVREMGGGSFV